MVNAPVVLVGEPAVIVAHRVAESEVKEGKVCGAVCRVVEHLEAKLLGRSLVPGLALGGSAGDEVSLGVVISLGKALDLLPVEEHSRGKTCLGKYLGKTLSELRAGLVYVGGHVVYVCGNAVEHTHVRGHGYRGVDGLRVESISSEGHKLRVVLGVSKRVGAKTVDRNEKHLVARGVACLFGDIRVGDGGVNGKVCLRIEGNAVANLDGVGRAGGRRGNVKSKGVGRSCILVCGHDKHVVRAGERGKLVEKEVLVRLHVLVSKLTV